MKSSNFYIDGHLIGEGRVFVIAEIGNNHNGSLARAIQLVEAAVDAGANCVKFQLRDRDALYRHGNDNASSEDLGVEYIQDLLNKVELSVSEHREIRAHCFRIGVTYMCTPWDEPSVDVLASMGVPAIKIASADLCNPYLIDKVAALGVPMILSTGMAYEGEILRAIEQLRACGATFALLHCNSTYPAPESDIQLPYILRLRELHPFVGYSGHERGSAITLAAVALGATIVERHITLDRSMEGPDHLASLEPLEFKVLVDGIRQIEKALVWTGPGREVSQGELLNRENLSKSVIASRSIFAGEVFTNDSLRVASPGQGLAPYKLNELLGKYAIRNIEKDDFLYESDISCTSLEALHFEFPIKWGIPVRYHDFKQFDSRISPDLYEFHLSYRDLNLNPAKYLHRVNCTRLVVHAPELFENSELLDLASDNPEYRERSIRNLQQVVGVTEEISQFFPDADSLLIVANVGGFSADTPFPLIHRTALYDRFYSAYKKIRFGRTELIPQNMAPFPWHFGGQRHQNIFMMPDELADQAEAFGLRLCLDLAHLMMTCNYFHLNFQEALNLLLPVTAHIHVSDALGNNGEGVAIGTGQVPWTDSWTAITRTPGMGFIPEVWQGHKDQGAGFWFSLNYLANISN